MTGAGVGLWVGAGVGVLLGAGVGGVQDQERKWCRCAGGVGGIVVLSTTNILLL